MGVALANLFRIIVGYRAQTWNATGRNHLRGVDEQYATKGAAPNSIASGLVSTEISVCSRALPVVSLTPVPAQLDVSVLIPTKSLSLTYHLHSSLQTLQS